MFEYERRYRVELGALQATESVVALGEPVKVVDLTFGLAGIDSMPAHGWIVRLRTVDSASRLEYKRRLGLSSWEEIGVGVDDAAEAARLMQRIGLTPGLFLSRERRSGTLDGWSIHVDRVQWLGDFVEFEWSEVPPPNEPPIILMGIPPESEAEAYGDQLARRLALEAELRAEHAAIVEAFTHGQLAAVISRRLKQTRGQPSARQRRRGRFGL